MKDYPAFEEMKFEEIQRIGRREVLTPTQVARALQVTPHAARNGMDGGAIKGKWRIPGSKHRRLSRQILVDHMKDMQHRNVGAIDPVTVELMRETNGHVNGTLHCTDAFSLGMAIASRPVREVLIHADAVKNEAGDAVQKLTKQIEDKFAAINLSPPPIRIIGS
jgi:hypothetical protein